jgi:ABC-2 type transport system ATP-binding protein
MTTPDLTRRRARDETGAKHGAFAPQRTSRCEAQIVFVRHTRVISLRDSYAGRGWLRGVSGVEATGAGLPAAVTREQEQEVDRSDAVIEVSGLTMSYDGLDAVRGIDLRVRRGEIFTFLGPNGAGKTTTVEILEGHRRRTGGEVQVLGIDPEDADRRWRARVGVVLQSSRVEQDLTVRECLELYAGYYPAPRSVSDVIKLVGLKNKANARGKQLSGGQQRRMDVALALIGDPELVFMDEPTTGFDPSARRAAWEMINGLRELGKTIFLTTHYMEEAEALADRIAVLSAGRIVAEGTPSTLGGRDRAAYQISFTLPDGVAADKLPVPGASVRAHDGSRRILIETGDVMSTLHALSGWSVDRALEIPDLQVHRPTLEDVYLQLTEPTR